MKDAIQPNALVYTDALSTYTALTENYRHYNINKKEEGLSKIIHLLKDGRLEVHVNTIESTWKRLRQLARERQLYCRLLFIPTTKPSCHHRLVFVGFGSLFLSCSNLNLRYVLRPQVALSLTVPLACTTTSNSTRQDMRSVRLERLREIAAKQVANVESDNEILPLDRLHDRDHAYLLHVH